jgi:hypothetical protein
VGLRKAGSGVADAVNGAAGPLSSVAVAPTLQRERRAALVPLAAQAAAVSHRPYPVELALGCARALSTGAIGNADLAHLLEHTERNQLGPLRCLECAIASRDEYLMQLVAHAVIADWPGVHVFADGKQMRRGPRVDEHRRDRWGRVLGHLSGAQVGLLDPREATSDPGDRKAYVRAWVTDAGVFVPERRGFSVVLEPGAARGKRHVVPRADRDLVADVALKLQDAGTLKVEWGWIGSTKPRWCQTIPVPRAARAVRALVRGTIDEAEVAAIAALRRSGRRHVDNMAAAVAIYLLRDGHGALASHGWRTTVRLYFERPDTTDESTSTNEHNAVTKLYAEAKNALARWRTYHSGR